MRERVGGRRSAVGSTRDGRIEAPDDAPDDARAHRSPPTADRLSIRPASIADLATVVALRVALLREHSGNAVYGRLRPDLTDRARRLFAAQLESEQEVTFLAERVGGGRESAVGVLRCVDAAGSPLLFPARYAYVSSVYVVPEERQRGVLHALLAAAERWSRDRGLREMRLHNAADNDVAGHAWQALGFDVVEVLRIKTLE